MGTLAKLLPGRAVLVVEDDPTVRRVIAKILEDAGLSVVEASDGSEAVPLLEAGGSSLIGLVVSDIVMPGFPGDQLAAKVAEQWPEVPVLLVSGFGMKAGCTGPFLAKPFTPEALLLAIEELLKAGHRPQSVHT